MEAEVGRAKSLETIENFLFVTNFAIEQKSFPECLISLGIYTH